MVKKPPATPPSGHQARPWYARHWKDSLVVLVAHGSETAPGAANLVEAHARTLGARGMFSEVRAAFLRGAARPRDIIENAKHDTIYIVPYMISDGYSIETLIPSALGLSGQPGGYGSRTGQRRIHICQSIGTHHRVTDSIINLLHETISGASLVPSKTAIAVAAHGTGRHQGNFRQANALAAVIAKQCGVDNTFAVFIEEPPYLAEWKAQTDNTHVIVVPYLMTVGSHATVDIPGAFGLSDRMDLLNRCRACMATGRVFGPCETDHHVIWYLPVVGSGRDVCEIIIDRIARFAHRDHVYRDRDPLPARMPA